MMIGLSRAPACVDEALISRGGTATDYADRLELVHHLGDAHEDWHRTERQAREVDVGAARMTRTPRSASGSPNRRCRRRGTVLVDGDDFGRIAEATARSLGGVYGFGFDGHAVVGRNREETGVRAF